MAASHSQECQAEPQGASPRASRGSTYPQLQPQVGLRGPRCGHRQGIVARWVLGTAPSTPAMHALRL
eukprot:5399360-Alexandrium_andersonii.AAC.1